MALHSVYMTVDCSFMISKHVPNDHVVHIKLYIYDSACGITRLKPIKMKLALYLIIGDVYNAHSQYFVAPPRSS
jgi:hypothetical protein